MELGRRIPVDLLGPDELVALTSRRSPRELYLCGRWREVDSDLTRVVAHAIRVDEAALHDPTESTAAADALAAATALASRSPERHEARVPLLSLCAERARRVGQIDLARDDARTACALAERAAAAGHEDLVAPAWIHRLGLERVLGDPDGLVGSTVRTLERTARRTNPPGLAARCFLAALAHARGDALTEWLWLGASLDLNRLGIRAGRCSQSGLRWLADAVRAGAAGDEVHLQEDIRS